MGRTLYGRGVDRDTVVGRAAIRAMSGEDEAVP